MRARSSSELPVDSAEPQCPYLPSNALAALPPGTLPTTRIVTPKIELIESKITQMDSVLASLVGYFMSAERPTEIACVFCVSGSSLPK